MIGISIRILRTAKKLRSVTIAANAGISPAFLSLVESGDRVPSPEVLDRIADALSVPRRTLRALANPIVEPSSAEDPRERLTLSVRKLADAEKRLRAQLDAMDDRYGREHVND